MLIGFCTGALRHFAHRISKENFALASSFGANVLEVLCRNKDHLLKLLNETEVRDFSGFKYISVHAPALLWEKENNLQANFDLFQKIYEKFSNNLFSKFLPL